MLESPPTAPAPRDIPEVVDKMPSTPALAVEGSVREEISKLVMNLFLLPGTQGPRHVVFAGMETGAGCSWMCARVGEVLASQINGTVCVVDCNLRHPCLHHEFAISNHFGLSDSLLQSGAVHQYARQSSRKNLWLLSCGSTIDNWHEQVTSETLRMRLMELRAQFDYVLMDVAPMNAGNDCIVLGKSADGVVLVLKANSTRRENTQGALKELKAANIPILGAVLNQRTFPIPDKIYNWL